MMKRFKRLRAAVMLFVLSATALTYMLRASLPHMDGEIASLGLEETVIVERDPLGIPTIRAATRKDLAHTLGFLHAQERYFQMDLLRKSAAGELCELVGPAALPLDKERRTYAMRRWAEATFGNLSEQEQQMLQAYTDGVNAGLKNLSVRPPEYLMLRTTPKPWTPEDTVLAGYALFFTLEDCTGRNARLRWTMKETLPPDVYDWMVHNGSSWHSTMDHTVRRLQEIPGKEAFAYLSTPHPYMASNLSEHQEHDLGGSNQWAIGGDRTHHGAAIVAGDMHLKHSLPNVWYRAKVEYGHNGKQISVVGASLPGTPLMICGSNGKIAWSFTNAMVSTSDLVLIDENTPTHMMEEVINIKGAEPVTVQTEYTNFGPVIPGKVFGRRVAIQWAAQQPGAINMRLAEMELVESAEAGIALAQQVRIPNLNIVIGDDQGNIGWTIVGYMGDREGQDPELPIQRPWTKPLTPERTPKIINPDDALLWTANNQVVGGKWEKLLGDGGYKVGARAYQVYDAISVTRDTDEDEMLQAQLDDRALFLERWQKLMVRVLSGKPEWADLLVEVANWEGRAVPNSVGFRLVREFRDYTADRVMKRVLAPCYAAWDEFDYGELNYEEALWSLVSQKPEHAVDPKFGSWDLELEAVIEDIIANEGRTPRWGERNVLAIHHPLTKAVPALGVFLNMPSEEVPGDYYMTRMQAPSHGASQRMVVAPGKESEGIFHMPGGQSGHFLSPHYGDQHDAWVKGEGTSLLPGRTVHTLRLVPAS